MDDYSTYEEWVRNFTESELLEEQTRLRTVGAKWYKWLHILPLCASVMIEQAEEFYRIVAKELERRKT